MLIRFCGDFILTINLIFYIDLIFYPLRPNIRP